MDICMQLCMYIHICIYIYIFMYLHIHTHTLYNYICIIIYVLMCIYIYTYIYVRIHTHASVYSDLWRVGFGLWALGHFKASVSVCIFLPVALKTGG